MEEASSHDLIESPTWWGWLFNGNNSWYQVLWYASTFLISWLLVRSSCAKFRLITSDFDQSTSKTDDENINHKSNGSNHDNNSIINKYNQTYRNIIPIIKKTFSADDIALSTQKKNRQKNRGVSLMSGKLSDENCDNGNESITENNALNDSQQLKNNLNFSNNNNNKLTEEEEDMDQEQKEYNLFVSTYHENYGLSKEEGNLFAEFEYLILPPACRRLSKRKMKSIKTKPSISVMALSTSILTNIVAAIIIILSHATQYVIRLIPPYININGTFKTDKKSDINTSHQNDYDHGDDNDKDISHKEEDCYDENSVTDNSIQSLSQSNTILMNTAISPAVLNHAINKNVNSNCPSTFLPGECSPLTPHHLMSADDDDNDDLDDQSIPMHQEILLPDESISSQYFTTVSSTRHHPPQASSSPPVPSSSLPPLLAPRPSSMKKKDALESFRWRFRDASNTPPNIHQSTSGLYTPPNMLNTTTSHTNNPLPSNNKLGTSHIMKNTFTSTDNTVKTPERIIQTSKKQNYMHDTKTPILSNNDKNKPIPKSPRHSFFQSRLTRNNSNNSNSIDLNFFDAINSQSFLRKLSRDTPLLPDKNGYIGLGDEFLRNKAKDTPLLVFVNSRAGSQQGLLLQTQLKRLLNPIQIWDLGSDGGPELALESFSVFSRLRILVCGGDGTVSWIISALDKMINNGNSNSSTDENHHNNNIDIPFFPSNEPQKLQRWPPIAILPLGTGNDLARVYGWGGGYNNESLLSILQRIQNSYVSLLDRWELQIIDESKTSLSNTHYIADNNNTPPRSNGTKSNSTTSNIHDSNHNPTNNTITNTPNGISKSNNKDVINNNIANFASKSKSLSQNIKKEKKVVKNFTNYMSIGSDASSALQVHMLRENSPTLFFSRAVNKIWYAIAGAEDALKASCAGLQHIVSIVADGVEVPIPANSQGIIILNIDSYTGGVPLWSKGNPVFRRKKKRILRERRYSEGEVSLCGSSTGLPAVDLSFAGINVPQSRVKKRTGSFDGTESLEGSDIVSYQNTNTGLTSVLDENNTKAQEDRFEYVTSCNKPSSCQDGKLDIVSYRNNFHLGQIRVGLSNADLLCQCHELTITLKKKAAVQVDGEPWRQDKCHLKIKKMKEPAIMLHKAADDLGGVETEMAKLLDWAEDQQIINQSVHATLMREFSRRIESKTREKRDRPPNNLIYSVKKAITSSNTLSSMY